MSTDPLLAITDEALGVRLNGCQCCVSVDGVALRALRSAVAERIEADADTIAMWRRRAEKFEVRLTEAKAVLRAAIVLADDVTTEARA